MSYLSLLGFTVLSFGKTKKQFIVQTKQLNLKSLHQFTFLKNNQRCIFLFKKLF